MLIWYKMFVKKTELVNSGADQVLIDVFEQQIDNLQEEHR